MAGPDTLSIGKYGLRANGVFEYLKVGHWQYFYPNGNLKEEGEYHMGRYVQCCFSGPCYQYYHYRKGIWKYYKEDGTLKYELNFQPTQLHVNTSCRGGDTVDFGVIKDFSLLEQKYGLERQELFKLQQVVIEDPQRHRKRALIPLSGELIFRSINDD